MGADWGTTAWTRRRFLGAAAVGLVGVAGAATTGTAIADWLPGSSGADPARDPDLLPGDAAHLWLRATYDVVWHEGSTPTNAARIYGYLAVAMYESVAPASSSLRSLAGQLTGLKPLPRTPSARTDPVCVLAAAVRTVTDHLLRSTSPQARQYLAAVFAHQIEARRAAGVSPGVVSASVEHGVLLGRSLVAWIAADGHAGTVGRTYTPPVGESLWRPSPPIFGEAVEPYWSEVRPMVLRRADEVVPVAHVPYSANEGSAFSEQARATYQAGLALTQAQRQTAMFWRDNPHSSGLPAGHWMQITRQMCEQQGLSLTNSVEAYVRAGVALHDAFLNCWTWKYRYNLIRPVDYVHEHIAPQWKTWVDTPQFPEYTSGHSVGSAAAATVLTDLFGNLAFTDTNTVPDWGTRQFGSFRQAADEAAISRLYGGIHYPMGIDFGIKQGDEVGAIVVERLQTRR